MFKYFLFFIGVFFAVSVNAHPKECCTEDEKPKVIYKTKWKTKIVEKKVPHYIPVKEKCCKKANKTIHRSKTGNQKVIIQMPKQKEKIIIKYKTRIKRKKVKVKVTQPNRLQLLVGQSKTEQIVKQKDCCDIEATRDHELDVGVQYLRDFGDFTGSITGTKNGSYYFGLGANW